MQKKEGRYTMAVGELCVRDVVVTSRTSTIQEAAQLMRQHHVGNVVVVEDVNGRKPVGIVTDRDIVLSVIATKLDPTVFTLGDLLMQELVSVDENTGVFDCVQKMRMNGVRRMPVVDAKGGLVGIVTVDDLIQLLAEEMNELAKVISREQAREVKVRR
jgi:CBS domain-containing protein